MCPHAQPVASPLTQGTVYVNRAPHYGFGGQAAMVNRLQESAYKRAMYGWVCWCMALCTGFTAGQAMTPQDLLCMCNIGAIPVDPLRLLLLPRRLFSYIGRPEISLQVRRRITW